MDITYSINEKGNIIYLPEIAQQFAEFINIIWLKGKKKIHLSSQNYRNTKSSKKII